MANPGYRRYRGTNRWLSSSDSFGGIQDLIGQETGWDRKTVALAATLGTWASGLTMPFIGRLVDRFGPRWIMLIAANMVGIGYIYLSNSNTCLLYTSPSPRDGLLSRMPSSA